MKIEWWMLDGIVCIALFLSALIGMKRGIGDTLIRLLGLAGGVVAALLYGKSCSSYLMTTPLKKTVYDRVFSILRPEEGSLSKALPGTIGNAADEAANKAVAATAEKVTESLVGIIAFVGVVLAVWLVAFIIRTVFKKGRKKSLLISGTDSLIGLSLGIVKGAIIACLLVMALVPGTALLAPDKTLEVVRAMQESHLTKMIYEINPLLTALKSLFRL